MRQAAVESVSCCEENSMVKTTETAAETRQETIASTKGVTIFVRSWVPPVPRAVLVICHGVNSHGDNMPGPDSSSPGQHSPSSRLICGDAEVGGLRYYVDDVADYVDDLAAVIALAKARHPGLPVFLLGHSAGGVVSCSYALDHQKELAGLICESFAFRFQRPSSFWGSSRDFRALRPVCRSLPSRTRISRATLRPSARSTATRSSPMKSSRPRPSPPSSGRTSGSSESSADHTSRPHHAWHGRQGDGTER